MIKIDEQYLLMKLGEINVCQVVVHNPNKEDIIFKVRSTGSKQYQVIPTVDIIKANSNLTITIKNISEFTINQLKDVFLILSDIAPPDVNYQEFWKGKTGTHNQEIKIQVQYPQLLQQVRQIEHLTKEVDFERKKLQAIDKAIQLYGIKHIILAFLIGIAIGVFF